MIKDKVKQYDISIGYLNGNITIEFANIDNKDILTKFTNKKEWLSTKEFPTGVELHRFLEKYYDKPQDWFLNNYLNALMDACDRVSILKFGKIFGEAFGQETANLVGYHILFWLLFLSKELKYERLPDIYSSVNSNVVN